MHRLIAFGIVSVLTLLGVTDIAAGDLRVLFVGNSVTYYNNMPAMLEAIASANPEGPAITTELHAAGGRELAEALELTELIELVRSGDWDLVVLQEQSRLGNTNFVNGRNVVADPEPFFEATRAWTQLATAHGAQALLLASWLDRDEAEREWEMVGWAFREIGREAAIPVLGLDLAWKHASQVSPEIDLYDADQFHPSGLGSLLIATSIYMQIARLDDARTVVLPSTFSGAYIEPGDGAVDPDRIVELGRFDDEELRAIRTIATESKKLEFSKSRPPLPEYPRLPDQPVTDTTATDFAGNWTGEARHYPNFLPWPGRMTLELTADSVGHLAGRLSIEFEDVKFKVNATFEGLEVVDGRLVFEDPDGPEDSVIRYEGILDADGTLIGVANLIKEGSTMRMTGDWRLEKVTR